MTYKILAINPGSTSTKIAVYEDEKPLFVESLEHGRESLAPFKEIIDQYELRRDMVLATLKEHGLDPRGLAAVVGRGGLLPPVAAGAYEVNAAMIDQLRHRPVVEHASNLGALIADEIAKIAGVRAYIYDSVTVDEMIPLVKITGLPSMRRIGMGHNLNMRASAIRYAKERNKRYAELTLIVAHLGGGSTLSLHHQGRMIDMISDDEGPFSPERAGGLPCFQLVDLMSEIGGDKKRAMKILRSQGGLLAHLGTTDARAVEAMIDGGDERAALVYEAMALNIAKNAAKLAVVVNGRVDAVVLTGGLVYSKRLSAWITERISFIAPVVLMPGENEMDSLAGGVLRVLRGEETAKTYVGSRSEPAV
ncbi:MAG: butyrate kinase [Candidatus Adiutrix sp.]|jgi:butyrate kinase|nr:butyrate kinase [Candidatus Adiutrix sp.]